MKTENVVSGKTNENKSISNQNYTRLRRARKSAMKNKLLFILSIVILSQLALAQSIPEKWLTYYEKSNFKKTPRYEETLQFCKELEKASPWIKVTNFGKSPQGREMVLVIASSDKTFDAKKAATSKKATILIQNGIHSGEIDGKDACLMLLRDIAITKTKASLLDHVNLLIIPFFNVDGHERFGKYNRINQNGPEEMGWRVTSQNLNLNRDYLKADAPEMQSWLKLFNAWLPEFFVDCHVTDGADFQHVVTYGIETRDMIAEPVRSWIKDAYIPTIESRLKDEGVNIVPYVFFADNKEPMKGLLDWPSPPRFSTVYSAIQNRPGLLIETHMLKDYKTRVDGTYKTLVATIQKVNEDYAVLKKAVNDADEQTKTAIENPYPLLFSVGKGSTSSTHFLGFKHTIEKSDISGSDWIKYTNEPYEADIPRLDSIYITKTIEPPKAYLIPPQWQEVLARLKIHGVKLERMTASLDLDVEMYRFSNAKWQERPYEGRHPVTFSVEKFKEKRTFPSGTIVAWMNQRTARVLIHALEPEAPDAFVQWGFFDAIFEQKEYFEDYVMEKVAREMIAANPKFKSEFDYKLQNDSAFAKSPYDRLNFFYQKSPFWDMQINLYPVARLMWEVPIPTEPMQ